MAFLVWVAVDIVLTIAASLLAKRVGIPKSAPAAQEPPTADLGRSIPIVWGTCKVRPNVLFFGNTQHHEFTRDGRFAGYTYHASMAFGICWGPIDALADIIFDNTKSIGAIQDSGVLQEPRDVIIMDPPLPIPLSLDGLRTDMVLDAWNLFGGTEKEGSVSGTIQLQFGTEEQELNTFLEYLEDPAGGGDPLLGYVPSVQSAWPRLCYAVFTDDADTVTPDTPVGPLYPFYWGVTGTPKPVHFVVQRFPAGANGEYTATIPSSDGYEGANPAEMIYEILTGDDWWGLRIDPAKLDLVSFQNAAQTLFDEGFGLSMQVDAAHPSDETIADILRYIDGVVYTHPTTQLITLSLIRADFDPDDIPKITPANSRELEFYRPSYGTLATMVKAKFTNTSSRNFIDDIAQWSNAANLEAAGEERIEILDFPSIMDPVLATAVTFREAKQLTLPFGRGTFKCDRGAFDFVKGTPFELTWPEEEIGPLVCRVASVDRGSLEDGQLTISFVEDVFFLEADGLTGGIAGGGLAVVPVAEVFGGPSDGTIDGGTP